MVTVNRLETDGQRHGDLEIKWRKGFKKEGGVINAADVSSQIRLEKGVLDLVMGKKLRVLLRTILVEKWGHKPCGLTSLKNRRRGTEAEESLDIFIRERQAVAGGKCEGQRFLRWDSSHVCNGINDNTGKKISGEKIQKDEKSHECHRGLFKYRTCWRIISHVRSINQQPLSIKLSYLTATLHKPQS